MIYLVRHGQTEFNAVGRIQGQLDSALTLKGAAQGRAVGLRLAGLIGSTAFRIYTSPLGRAQDTARIIAVALPGMPEITLEARLMEVGMGAWDGMTDFEIEAEYPGSRDGLGQGQWFLHGPGGERYEGLRGRLAAALAEIAADRAAVKIIVSHGVAGQVVRGIYGGLSRVETLVLEMPQVAFFALEDGKARRIEA